MENDALIPRRLPIADVARKLGVTAPTVRSLIRKKELAGFTIGGRRFVTAASLEVFAARIRGEAGEAA